MLLSTATNERSQTLFYIMRSIDMNFQIVGILIAIGQSDSQIEVIKKLYTYFLYLVISHNYSYFCTGKSYLIRYFLLLKKTSSFLDFQTIENNWL